MLKSIKNMLQAFEDNKIQYCHWKSNEHLEEALRGDTDLDVLFMPEQRALLEQILNECGLKRFRAMPLMQYNAIEDYIGFDVETAKIWHLHTHYRMTMGEKHLKGYTLNTWGYEIIKNRILDVHGIYTSSREDELILLFVRISMKLRFWDYFKSLSNDDVREMKWLLEEIDKEKFLDRINLFLKPESAMEVSRLLSSNLCSKKQLMHLRSILVEEFKYFTGYSKISSLGTQLQRTLFWLIGALIRHSGFDTNNPYRRVSPSGGSVIAILGCDGAGKSTTISYLKKEFNKKIDVKTVYLGSGDGDCSLLRKPLKYVAKKVGGKGLGFSVEKEYIKNNKKYRSISIKARLYSVAKIIWACALALEKKNKLSEITNARNKGMLVLVDRYPQVEIEGYNDGPLMRKYKDSSFFLKWISEWEYKIYQSAYINPPDLIIKLMVSTELAMSRKPEMTVDEIEKKKKAVVAMNPSRNSLEVYTDVPFKKTIGEVMEAIWRII